MLKKISIFMLILMLTFSPVASLNANAQEADDVDTTEEDAETEDQVNDESEDADSADSEATEADAGSEEATDAEESDQGEPADEEAVTEDENATAEEDENQEEIDESEDAVEPEDEEEADQEQADEDLDLEQIYGTANGEITYDFNKGYYILDLQAGLSEYSGNQVLQDKWVAFALPNGITLANADVPSGVVQVSIKGKRAIAVKIPDVGSFPDAKYVYPNIPLVGEVNDNDPVENLYLLNVDVDAQQFENLGQIKSQRNIDFSVMEENPTLDLHGSITGSTTYDEDKKYHFLDVTVKTLNQTDNTVNDLYVAFDLPENVEVVNDENTPPNMEILNLENSRAVALKLPNLDKGNEKELTYRIPVVGVSDSVVTSETISVFKILDAGYNQVGQFEGHINVDFSDMDIAWHFDAIAQIIPDYPGISGNQQGFNFKYEVKNIDVKDVEKVKMEFNVPNGIKILEPDYNGSSRVEVDWNGNLATLTFGDLSGTSGFEGYFTAIGETSKSINELKAMEVKVTLFRDGDTVVETINVPFEVGAYADIGLPGTPEEPEDPETPGNEDDDDTTEPGTGDDDNNGTGGDSTPGENDDNAGNNGDSSDTGTGSDDNDDVKVTVEDGDDTVKDGDNAAAGSSDNGDGALPNTATNMYSYMLIGALTLIAGASLLVFRRKNVME